MKAKYLISGISSLIFIMFSGCQKEFNISEKTIAQGNAKLKRVLLYSTFAPEDPLSILDEYEYDTLGRLNKVSHPMYEDGIITGVGNYELYEYNSDGRVLKIMSYNYNTNPGIGFVNHWNRIYSYSTDGKITKVYTGYPGPDLFEYSLYKYKNDQLIKIEKYYNADTLKSYILNQYNNSGELIKETTYAYDNQPISYTLNTYSNGLK